MKFCYVRFCYPEIDLVEFLVSVTPPSYHALSIVSNRILIRISGKYICEFTDTTLRGDLRNIFTHEITLNNPVTYDRIFRNSLHRNFFMCFKYFTDPHTKNNITYISVQVLST